MITKKRFMLAFASVALVTGCSLVSPPHRDQSNANRSVFLQKISPSDEPTENIATPKPGSSTARASKDSTRDGSSDSIRDVKREPVKDSTVVATKDTPTAAVTKQENEPSRLPGSDPDINPARKNVFFNQLKSDDGDARRALAQGDFAKAAKIYRKAADDGDIQAQIALGDMYTNGRGVKLDYGTAIKLYQSALKAGESAALSRIAYLTTQGWGVIKNVDKGVELMRDAAAKGDPFARGKLGLMYMSASLDSKLWVCGPVAQACVSESALSMFQAGLADNDPESTYFLGEFYRIGRGVPLDEQEAFRLLKKSADLGHPSAMQSLGSMFLHGTSVVSKDVGKGVAWLKTAANQNLADAQNALGVLYADGSVVPVNTKEAVIWYQRAAEQGHAIAQANLAHMYRFGRGVKRELVTAYKWYWIAARQFMMTSPGMKVAADISKRALEATMAPGDIEKAKSQATQWMEKNQKAEL